MIKGKPFVKWAGGKRQIIDKLNKYVPDDYNTYYEPFVGGGALLFELSPKNAVINDSNKELMNVYKCLCDEDKFKKMCTILNHYEAEHSEQFFYEIIPQYLKEYKFIQQLMLPEAEIKDIVGEENKEFINQKVDFYLEPCKLVIEIDGLQHESELQLQIDSQRDEYLSKFGVKTIVKNI